MKHYNVYIHVNDAYEGIYSYATPNMSQIMHNLIQIHSHLNLSVNSALRLSPLIGIIPALQNNHDI